MKIVLKLDKRDNAYSRLQHPLHCISPVFVIGTNEGESDNGIRKNEGRSIRAVQTSTI